MNVKVNGLDYSIEDDGRCVVLASDILKLVQSDLPSAWNRWRLQGDGGVYDVNAMIDLRLDSRFITVPTAPTRAA